MMKVQRTRFESGLHKKIIFQSVHQVNQSTNLNIWATEKVKHYQLTFKSQAKIFISITYHEKKLFQSKFYIDKNFSEKPLVFRK